ncbi:hypothetical protein CLAIMM_02279 [Cladophialophora immunda]|nr:hypothetical protein CLAIMM_02279 [Cladophialophora immunda]
MANSQYSSAKYASITAIEREAQQTSQTLDPFRKPVSQGKALGWILLYHKRTSHTPNPNPAFAVLGEKDEPGVYYVDISAATFVFIASWSSTIANTLTACVVALLGFPLAALLRRQYQSGQLGGAQLSLAQAPQFCLLVSLLVSLLAGQKLKVLREYLQLAVKRHDQGWSVNLGVAGLVVAIVLSWFIIAADTYLHLSTKSILLNDATPVDPDMTFGSSYVLEYVCLGNNTFYAQSESPCIFQYEPLYGSTVFLPSADGMSILSNDSFATAIYTYTPPSENGTNRMSTSYAYAGSGSFASNADFVAETFPVSTQCRFVTRSCLTNASEYLSAANFDCGPKYPAFTLPNMTAGTDRLFFFSGPDAASAQILNGSDPSRVHQNAFTFGVASATVDTSQYFYWGDSVDNFHYFWDYYLFFVMCDTSAWTARYTFFNGSVVPGSWSVKPSNASVSNLMQSTLAFLDVGYSKVEELIGASFTDSSLYGVDGPVTSFATGISSLVLGIAASGMNKADPVTVQLRFSYIVTKVQKGAVWALVGANIALALVGGLLFLTAVVALYMGGDDVCEILRRVGVNAVVCQAVAHNPDLGLWRPSASPIARPFEDRPSQESRDED